MHCHLIYKEVLPELKEKINKKVFKECVIMLNFSRELAAVFSIRPPKVGGV